MAAILSQPQCVKPDGPVGNVFTQIYIPYGVHVSKNLHYSVFTKKIEIHVSWQQFSTLASDWLAARPPANENTGLAILC